MKISSADISVVVQGAVDPSLLIECVSSIRQQLPDAEIILSTWDGTNISDSTLFDRVIFSKDPGAKPISIGGAMNNTNRQLVSTLSGIKAATRRYTLKLRTDCRLDGIGFIEAFEQYPIRNPAFSLFQHKVVIPRYATRLETSKRPYLFHPADIALFGLTTDLHRLFNIPLVTEEQFAWHQKSPDPVTRAQLTKLGLFCQLVPEQHLFIHALKQAGFAVSLAHPNEAPKEMVDLSRALLVNNYVVVNDRAFGLHHMKERLRDQIPADSATCYSRAMYEYVYKHYFDSNFQLDLSGKFWGPLVTDFKSIEGLLKHAARIGAYAKMGFKSIHKAAGECIVTLYWLIRSVSLLLIPRHRKISLPSPRMSDLSQVDQRTAR